MKKETKFLNELKAIKEPNFFKAYKFRIYPAVEQVVQIKKTFGCARFVYNHFLTRRKEQYRLYSKTFGYSACSSELTVMKKTDEYRWLGEADSTALQSSLRYLDAAYDNFFRSVKNGDKQFRYPKYKSKKLHEQSYTSKNNNNSIAVYDRQIKLPRLGFVDASVSKQVEGRIVSATVRKSPSGKYYVSVLCADVAIPQYASTGKSIGIDLGLKDIAVTSEGIAYTNNHHLKKLHKKLAREQRRLSRKQRGSSNYGKQRVRVALLHEKAANRRNDSIHKMTTELVRKYDVICTEDLNTKGMMKNHRLARAIGDASWSEIKRQLEYKCAWQHKALIQVSRFYPSSQMCRCGYRNSGVKNLNIRFWICPQCGAGHDRDINAAVNILNEGLRIAGYQEAG